MSMQFISKIEPNKKMIIKEILKHNLNKIIKIIPFQKNPFPYFLNADLFILSSKFEGLPNVLLEAQTLKKFIISSNCPTGPREILQNGKGGILFTPKNFYELSEKIIYFVTKLIIMKAKEVLEYIHHGIILIHGN